VHEALPIHVQMLLALRKEVERRQREHERKTGKGLEDRDYQRHVGRIAECDAQIAAINEMMKADLDEVADQLEEEQRGTERTQRTAKSNRRGQRGATTSADH
jgi:hypothetical protein